MWDPRRYLDTDFGLEDDEAFEPFEADDPEDIDPSRPHIMTVMGPIDPDDLGVCQPGEHVMGWSSREGTSPGAMPPNRLDLVANELEAFFTVGGRSMVDLSTRETGRDVLALRRLSQRVPVHLICATGRHALDHADDGMLDPAEFESELVGEIRAGIGRSGVRPGLIVLGTTRSGLVPADMMSAAASVAIGTGLPILTCGRLGSRAHELLDLMEQAGLAPNRAILDHLDSRLQVQELAGLARRGAWICFDRIGTDESVPDRQFAKVVLLLAEAGFAGNLLLSQRLVGPDQFTTTGGGPGWIHLLERFTLDLMAAGAGAGLVRTLLVENTARALTIEPKFA